MKFKTFTNANVPYEGKKIAIDMNEVQSIFEDVTKADEGKYTTLWSPNNVWTVQEDFNTVMKIIGENS
jgi:hypothetical protein|tara:strand:- start:1858 stop:2061 length:204 start_codon:yes stop_codon:yes gene_type:complete